MQVFKEDMKIKISDYGFTILQIESMLACNMNCKFCAYPIIKNKGGRLSSEEVYEIIDSVDAGDDKLEYICFNQFNEPLLDKRIFDFIKYAKEKNFKVLIITNGLVFKSKEIRDKLIWSEPNFIKISLHTLNENSFRNSRGIRYSLEDYKKGIFEFLSASLENDTSSKITIDIACNFLSRKSLIVRKLLGIERGDPSVPDTIDDIKEEFIMFLRELCGYDSRLCFDEEKANEYLKTIKKNYLDQEELPIDKNISIKIKQFIYGRKLSEFYPIFKGNMCGTKILSVIANGSVVPCCLSYDNLLSMGNIRKESLKQIIDKNRDLIANIKKGNNLPEICKRCEGAPTLRGAICLSMLNSLRSLKMSSN